MRREVVQWEERWSSEKRGGPVRREVVQWEERWSSGKRGGQGRMFWLDYSYRGIS